MLLPRFSLRLTLLLVTGAACFFVVVAEAVRGRAWAAGVAVAIGSVLAALATYAALFGFCSLLSRLVGVEQVVAKTSRGALLRDAGSGAAPVAPTPPVRSEEAS